MPFIATLAMLAAARGDRDAAGIAARLRGALGWHDTARLLLACAGVFLFVILIAIF